MMKSLFPLFRPVLFVMAVVVLSYGIWSCSSVPEIPDEAAEELQKQAEDKDAEGDRGEVASDEFASAEVPVAGAGRDESECLGQLVPPRGAGGRQYDQETAISQQASFEELTEQARTELRDRICQGILCGQIEQQITIWEPQESEGYRCVMAVIAADQLEEWKRAVETDLGTRLQAHAQDVVERVQESLGGGTPRMTIHNIDDHGVPGGLRSEWLHRHLQDALDRASAHVIPLDPSWSGQGLPDRADGVVTAQIVPMGGVEDSLEVSWQARTVDRVFSGGSVHFPEVVAPDIDRSTYLPPFPVKLDDDKVALHFDRRDGGGLCHGQKTEIWLETAQDMHVRVINLFGSEGGSVIFPPMPETDDLIEAGQPISLGEFEAFQAGNIGVERFLVVASPTPDGLGRFESVDQFCTLPPTMVQSLQQGHDLPHGDETYLFETGFRLMDGEGCQEYDASDQYIARVEEALAAAPGCW